MEEREATATQFIQPAIHAGRSPYPFSCFPIALPTFYHLANSFEALQPGNCLYSVVILNIPKYKRVWGLGISGWSMGVGWVELPKAVGQ